MSMQCLPDLNSSSKVCSDSPFFTVLIPTMNRTQLLKSAVESVLFQTFKDFKLIISDNSDNETALLQNREIVKKYENDPRVNLITPPYWMNMPDHWEFASRHATGQYVLILTDRHVMRPSVLDFLHTAIQESPENTKVIAWSSSSSYSISGIVSTQKYTGDKIVVDSKQEFADFAKCDHWRDSQIWKNRLPRMLNSCYRFDVAHAIREKHGRLFLPLFPDYISAFFLLAFTEKYTYIDRPLIMSHGNKSNGNNSLIYGIMDYLLKLGDIDWFAGTPAPLYTPANFIIHDMMFVKNIVGKELTNVELDIAGYYATTYKEIMYMQKVGSQIDIRSLHDIIFKNIQQLSHEQQNAIKINFKELDRTRPSFIFLRRLAVRFKSAEFFYSIFWTIRRIRHKLASQPIYSDVLEAAQKTDYILTDIKRRYIE